MKNPIFWTLLAACAVLTTACGSKQEPPAPPPEPTYSHQGPGNYESGSGKIEFPEHSQDLEHSTEADVIPATGVNRADYCMVYVPQETDETVRHDFLKQLEGRWATSSPRREGFAPIGHNGPWSTTEFQFSLDPLYAWLKDYAWIDFGRQGGERIRGDRVCLSQPLVREDLFNGYRIVEIVDANGNGAAAFAVKFESPAANSTYPVLKLTHFHYRPHGGRDGLLHVRDGALARSTGTRNPWRPESIYVFITQTSVEPYPGD